MRKNVCYGALALFVALQSAAATAAPLPADSQWHAFDVDPLTAQSGGLEWIDLNGAAMAFSFVGPALLAVVDGGFAGDRFQVFDNGSLLGTTSAAVNTYPTSLGTQFDAIFADARFSRGVFALGAGIHNITGLLSLSAVDNTGNAIDASVGAVRLTAMVPEPGTVALVAAGLGVAGFLSRRRINRESNQ